ncbi:MAG: TIR domain-containing protein [Candidatus Omnitrophota bacterium]
MKRVFLSFSPEDTQKVKGLLPLLEGLDAGLDFYEVPLGMDFESEGAKSLKRAIGEKIIKCGVTVCLIGENSHKSKWVDCQLQKSRNKGNRIIAMALKKVESAVLPDVAREENLRFYPWDPKKLKELIHFSRSGLVTHCLPGDIKTRS